MFSFFRSSDSTEEDQTPEEAEASGNRLRGALDSFRKQVKKLWPGSGVSEETVERLEAALLQSDVSLDTVDVLLDPLRENPDIEDPIQALRTRIMNIFQSAGATELHRAESPPTVYFFIGVNGSGKTTTMAKLAHHIGEPERILFAAGDTFRAAAVEQLQEWATRLGVEVIAQEPGSDPSAVVFDAVEAAVSRRKEFLFVDTAGRLHTRGDLVEQLQKMVRVAGSKLEGAPHECLLVLDASTGQNGVRQVETFAEHLPVTGIVLTKLDSTAKGGVALTVARDLGVPVKMVGTGETLEDLVPFDPGIYSDALFAEEASSVR